jgi:hypothetical protein
MNKQLRTINWTNLEWHSHLQTNFLIFCQVTNRWDANQWDAVQIITMKSEKNKRLSRKIHFNLCRSSILSNVYVTRKNIICSFSSSSYCPFHPKRIEFVLQGLIIAN